MIKKAAIYFSILSTFAITSYGQDLAANKVFYYTSLLPDSTENPNFSASISEGEQEKDAPAFVYAPANNTANNNTEEPVVIVEKGNKGKNAEDEIMLSDNELVNQKFYFSDILGIEIDTVINPKVYENAIDWIKTPYHYGGNSKSGIDCSGFASVIYKNSYNITLGASSVAIYNEVEPVQMSDIREGDLVFFKIKRRRISHIGVYLGNNKFVHASTQGGVIISDLDESYYKKRFFAAGRHKALISQNNND